MHTPTRADYPVILPIQTRWGDNDAYGHVNNVVYYAYFDTAINHFLIHEGGLDIHTGTTIGLCVESQCAYLSPAAYPDALEAGLRVARLGRASVTYELGIFRSDTLCAHGHFIHVFVDRVTRKSSEIPPALRAALARLVVSPPGP